jgi:hypothetical protein
MDHGNGDLLSEKCFGNIGRINEEKSESPGNRQP